MPEKLIDIAQARVAGMRRQVETTRRKLLGGSSNPGTMIDTIKSRVSDIRGKLMPTQYKKTASSAPPSVVGSSRGLVTQKINSEVRSY